MLKLKSVRITLINGSSREWTREAHGDLELHTHDTPPLTVSVLFDGHILTFEHGRVRSVQCEWTDE